MGQRVDNLIDFSEDNIQSWIINYVNLNNNIYVLISESHDEVIKIE